MNTSTVQYKLQIDAKAIRGTLLGEVHYRLHPVHVPGSSGGRLYRDPVTSMSGTPARSTH